MKKNRLQSLQDELDGMDGGASASKSPRRVTSVPARKVSNRKPPTIPNLVNTKEEYARRFLPAVLRDDADLIWISFLGHHGASS